MKILAIEFSGTLRSAAIINDGNVFESVEHSPRHENAFGLIEKVLAAAKMEREEIECLAIGLGPGSYHGIRAAIALAQGWQLANGVKILGVSSVQSIVEQARAKNVFGKVRVVMDAQRNEFYVARYEINRESCCEIEPLRIAARAEILGWESAQEILIGPEITRWSASGKIFCSTAAMVGRLAAGRGDFAAGEKLEPIYLRETTFVKAPPLRTID